MTGDAAGARPTPRGRPTGLAAAVPVVRHGPVNGAGAEGLDPDVDLVAIEAPLAVDLVHGPETARRRDRIMTTMRTPGHDPELVLGWLIGEGLVERAAAVLAARPCTRADPGEDVLRVELDPAVRVTVAEVVRTGTITSACGACGRAARADRPAGGEGRPPEASAGPGSAAPPTAWPLSAVFAAPESLRVAQPGFRRTGGLHAAALFDRTGAVRFVREDVGRHNAVDKTIGAAAAAGVVFSDLGLVVSSRAGFEIVQKAAAAGVPIVASVGAATSAAISCAAEHRITVAGFVRGNRCVEYVTGGPALDAQRVEA